MDRIAVVGASGFIGSTLVEYLLESEKIEVVPIIHSTGNAWRLARHGVDLQTLDVVDASQVRMAIQGCTHVVNCVLTKNRTTSRSGLKNLLRASKDAGVHRFVHMSTVAMYEQQPYDQILTEESPYRRRLSGYAQRKLDEDRLVRAAHRDGLSCVLIAPPRITGAYSKFLMRTVDAMRSGALALIEGGSLPCSLVDVHDVARAIVLALRTENADGSRIFITNDEANTWKDLVESMSAFTEGAPAPTSFSHSEAAEFVGKSRRGTPVQSLRVLLRLLASPMSRKILRADPWLLMVYNKLIDRRVPFIEDRLRRLKARSSPPSPTASLPYGQWLGLQLMSQRYSCDKAKRLLSYEPRYGLSHSIQVFGSWFRATTGWGGGDWPLARQL